MEECVCPVSAELGEPEHISWRTAVLWVGFKSVSFPRSVRPAAELQPWQRLVDFPTSQLNGFVSCVQSDQTDPRGGCTYLCSMHVGVVPNGVFCARSALLCQLKALLLLKPTHCSAAFKIQEPLFIPRDIAVQQLWNEGLPLAFCGLGLKRRREKGRTRSEVMDGQGS